MELDWVQGIPEGLHKKLRVNVLVSVPLQHKT